jgi:hypothetical protein
MAQALFAGRLPKLYFLGGKNATLCEVFMMADSIAGTCQRPIPIPHRDGRAAALAGWLRSPRVGGRPFITLEWYDSVSVSVQIPRGVATADFKYRTTLLADAMATVVRWIMDRQMAEVA